VKKLLLFSAILIGAAIANARGMTPNPVHHDLYVRHAELGREINAMADKLASINSEWSARIKRSIAVDNAQIDASGLDEGAKFEKKLGSALASALAGELCRAMDLWLAGVSKDELEAKLKEFDELSYELSITPKFIEE
jgi:hypothetical protein